MTIEIYNLLLVEIAKTKLSHFTLHQSLKPTGSRKFEWMKNLPGVLHGMQWILIHGLPDFASSPPQRGGSNTILGDHDISTSHNPRCIITLLHKKGPHE
jgi:hypothetical protein